MNEVPHLEPTNIRRHLTKLVTKAPGDVICAPLFPITLFYCFGMPAVILDDFIMGLQFMYSGYVQWLCTAVM